MSSELLACPECAGQQLGVHDVRGILAIQHRITCSLGQADDATKHNDYMIGQSGQKFRRPITPTELTILTAWQDHLPMWKGELNEETETVVNGLTRDWPQLWINPAKPTNVPWLPSVQTVADTYQDMIDATGTPIATDAYDILGD